MSVHHATPTVLNTAIFKRKYFVEGDVQSVKTLQRQACSTFVHCISAKIGQII